MLTSEIAGVHRGSHFHSDLPECHFDETDLRKLPLHTNERLRAMGKKKCPHLHGHSFYFYFTPCKRIQLALWGLRQLKC